MKKNNSGFSLLEVIIALMIFSIGLSVIVKAQRGVNDRMYEAKEMAIISMLLEAKFKQLHKEYSQKKFDELDKVKTGNIEEPEGFSDYAFKAEVTEVEFPDFLSLMDTAEKEQEERGSEQSDNETALRKVIGKNMTEYLKKTVRELKVTVQGKGKEVSTSTYLVTFEEELQLSL